MTKHKPTNHNGNVLFFVTVSGNFPFWFHSTRLSFFSLRRGRGIQSPQWVGNSISFSKVRGAISLRRSGPWSRRTTKPLMGWAYETFPYNIQRLMYYFKYSQSLFESISQGINSIWHATREPTLNLYSII